MKSNGFSQLLHRKRRVAVDPPIALVIRLTRGLHQIGRIIELGHKAVEWWFRLHSEFRRQKAEGSKQLKTARDILAAYCLLPSAYCFSRCFLLYFRLRQYRPHLEDGDDGQEAYEEE